jgi:hypothetical protein
MPITVLFRRRSAVYARLRGVVRQVSGFSRGTEHAQDSVAMHHVLSTYTGPHGETSRQALRHHRTKPAQSKDENHANPACMRGRGDVEVQGARGWVYGGYLSYLYQGSEVPIMTYGAVIGLPLITFSPGTYWDHYYRERPWYHDRDRWAHHPPPPYRPPPPSAQPPGPPGTEHGHRAGPPQGGTPPMQPPVQGYQHPSGPPPQAVQRPPGPPPIQGGARPPAPPSAPRSPPPSAEHRDQGTSH